MCVRVCAARNSTMLFHRDEGSRLGTGARSEMPPWFPVSTHDVPFIYYFFFAVTENKREQSYGYARL